MRYLKSRSNQKRKPLRPRRETLSGSSHVGLKTMPNDDAITGDITSALATDPRVTTMDIRITTHNRLVRLTGIVDTLEVKTTTEEIARHVMGVIGVENDIAVSPNRSISDHDIALSINELLARQDMANIGARVNAGTAFLMGTIPSLAVKQRAVEIAGSVKGVRDVISELGIAAGEPLNDITLANDVAETLSDDPRLEILNLHIQASDGSISLAGEVKNQTQIDIATSVSESIPGVVDVHNEIKISLMKSSGQRFINMKSK